MPAPALCDPGANQFVERIFHDCLYTRQDMLGFGLGMGSICCWLVAQMPQIILNHQTQSVEALSAFFLASWLLGDTCNLLGCILAANQLPTQTFTAVYFILTDMVMMTQYVYYMSLAHYRWRTAAHRLRQQERHAHYRGVPQRSPSIGRPLSVNASAAERGEGDSSAAAEHADNGAAEHRRAAGGGRALAGVGALFVVGRLTSRANSQAHGGSSSDSGSGAAQSMSRRQLLWLLPVLGQSPEWALVAGNALGWVSSGFYLTSRLSQIAKNWQRSATEGLSLSMFACTIVANLLYGVSILLRATSWADIRLSAPWLLGSLGTVGMDITIFLQGMYYQNGDFASAQYKLARMPCLVTVPAGAEAYRLVEDR